MEDVEGLVCQTESNFDKLYFHNAHNKIFWFLTPATNVLAICFEHYTACA